MKFKVVVFAAIIGILGILSTPGSAANVTSNVTVNVSIASLSQITVSPNNLTWLNMVPGTVGGVINLTIKNTGSVNVTNIHAYANTNETEVTNPYLIDNPLNYSAGGVLVIYNTSDQRRYWVQRKEWNETSNISNMDLSVIGTTSRAASGFFRNVTNEYLWAVGNGTGSYCNSTAAKFAIEDDADTGSTGTRTPDDTGITFIGGDIANQPGYGYFDVNRSTSGLNGMCVAVRFDCTYILIYKFDKRPGFQMCGNSAWLRSNSLTPTSTEPFYADAYIPKGLPAGVMRYATLTVEAT